MIVMGGREEESKPLEERIPNRAVIVETVEMGTIPNGNSTRLSAPKPSWFTPKRLLVIFSVINLLNYLDRGAIGSNGVNGTRATCTKGGTCTPGTGIQGNFNLSNFQDGVLSSAFTVGLVVASPIFASLAKSVNPFRLIGVGLSVWTFATAGCGCSFNFWSITICRMLVGVGEASFISLAAPFIDDNAPAAQKTAWLGIFYMCIPAGVALGYVYGGLVGNHFSWRYAFFGEAILMFPFALLGFVMKPLQMRGACQVWYCFDVVFLAFPSYPQQLVNTGFPHAESKRASTAMETAVSKVKEDSSNKGGMSSIKEEFVVQGSEVPSKSKCGCINLNQFSRFFKDMKVLLLDKVFVVNVLGYISYNFVIGAYSYWGPKAGFSIYHMNNADMIFGGITVGCGILGTLAGGYVLDKMTSTISNAFKLLSVATLMGAGFCFAAFCFKSQYAFLVLFAIGELLVFATQAPVNYVCLHCVMPSMRPLSMAMSTVAIHIFGDVPSSPLVGVLQDNFKDWRKTTLILTSILFLAAGIWFIGIFLRVVDRFNEENEHPVATAKKSNTENTGRITESSGEP